ncbi:MAG TPA: tail fiber protein [Gaiellaceae bacterium]|nr:tail fiber protein [Gaiellaceae bacterium]
MSEPFVGEIYMAGFSFAPAGFAQCNGQLMPISQNTALFSLLGTFYGGDGKSTFALPNLQGSAPIGIGQGPGLSNYDQGETDGTTTVTLLSTEIPAHTHTVSPPAASHDERPTDRPAGAVPTTGGVYATNANSAAPMGVSQTSAVGGNPHNNMQPYLTVNFVIALQGVFPARS